MFTIPSAAPETRAALRRLLDDGLAWSATYRGRMSNHLPMVQQALCELGASADRLRAFTATAQAELEPQPAALPDRVLGQPGSEAAWRAHFTGRIAALGAGAALREALPGLLPGAAAIAFHGLIRTGHAVLAGHEGELAAGLAHWAAHWLPLPAASGPPLDLKDWLQALIAVPRPAYPAGSFIADRMRAWGDTPGFATVAGQLAHGPDTLRDLALLAARTYAASGNFTVLHLLTASHAMSVLEAWWPRAELDRGFSVAAAAGLLASGAEPARRLERPPRRAWPDLIEAACAQDDAHVIKLCHAAWRLDRRWPDPAWRAAVERALPG